MKRTTSETVASVIFLEQAVPADELTEVIRGYSSGLGFFLSCKECRYVVDGEIGNGWMIQTVNNPTEPKKRTTIYEFVNKLAEYLIEYFDQERITLVCGIQTIRLTRKKS